MRPILFHCFHRPLPYAPTLALQQYIHELQLQQRRDSESNQDILLLLEHRPVYTAGRRQTDQELGQEPMRLRRLGADFVATKRGGQITYHGPGQVYICKIQTMLKEHFLNHHGIPTIDSDNTGIFLTPNVKLASIGVQVRHRLTSHGFAYNVSGEPLAWFNEVIACGLADVEAGCISDAVGKQVFASMDLDGLKKAMSHVFERDIVELDTTQRGYVADAVRDLEAMAERLGPWLKTPALPEG